MNRKVIREISRVKELMGVISEQVVTDYDSLYDYKKEDGKYYTRRKGSNSWIEAKGSSLNAIKSKVFGDSSSSSSSSSSVEKSPFKTREEGDRFRKWVNDNYPDYAKQIDLDVSGSHTNSYIMKAWNKYGNEYKKGKSGDNNRGTETNKPKIEVSGYVADEYEGKIDFSNVNTQDTTRVCDANTEHCASFVTKYRKDINGVGDAWIAHDNPELGDLVFSVFESLDSDVVTDVIDLWTKIHDKGGGEKNGKYRTAVHNLVTKLVPPKGQYPELKVDDIVGIFYPTSEYHEKAFYDAGKIYFTDENGKINPKIGTKAKPGNTIKKGKGWGMNTHVGVVGSIIHEDGKKIPIILHNIHGDVFGDPPENLRIAWVRRKGVVTKFIDNIVNTVSNWSSE